MLFITFGTLAVGVLPACWGWLKITDQWFDARQRVIPAALCALTLSILLILTGSVIYDLHSLQSPSYPDHSQTIWWIFFTAGFLLNTTALVLLRVLEQKDEAHNSVLLGSIGVAVIHVLGLLWFWS